MLDSMTPVRILIVEDEAITAMSLRQTLTAKGFTVVAVAATGSEAIEIAQREKPDLLLMDIRLADDIDGIEAATVINNGIPIIYMTAFVDEPTITRAEETGPIAILEKPLNIKRLITLIGSAR
jgi:two-component system, response regulator PdtaR